MENENINEKISLVSINDLLMENLNLPDYQRPYRWTCESAMRLLTDTYNAFKENISEYRLGSLVLHKVNNDGSTIFDIVDGQQRITTILIILFAFYGYIGYYEKKDFSNEESTSKSIGSEKNQYQKSKYFGELSLLNKLKYKELSNESIVNNFNIIRRKLKEFGNNELEKYRNYFINNCKLVKIIVSSEQEAFQFFDSQNTRGRALSPHDLLKSYHLREMRNESEILKTQIINDWENINQRDLEDLFANNLYPLVRWYRNKDGLNYLINDIKIFKGIKANNTYNFSIYNKAANLYIEKLNREDIYELLKAKPLNQFQLTQEIIGGRRFFLYVLHYMEIYKKIEKLISTSFLSEMIPSYGVGDLYVYNLFVNVLIFYVDKFSFDALTESRLLFFYKWAYSLRLSMKAVYKQSINKYALGNSDRINYGINLFECIYEMQEPIEIDMIILDEISKAYSDKYDYIYSFIYEKEGLNNND